LYWLSSSTNSSVQY